MNRPIEIKEKFEATCPICDERKTFSSADDFWSCRDGLKSDACAWGSCLTRERAVANALFSLFPRNMVKQLAIHEAAPCARGLTLWMMRNCPNYVQSGYFQTIPFGEVVHGIRNEDLENQTFENNTFDLVIHLDVMEHLYHPFKALKEIHRTLKPGGVCLFTVPTEYDRVSSEQVAFMEDGKLRIIGEPEYHGNPQNPEAGSLVTWRYGYDLPLLIQRETSFDVELRRAQSRGSAVMGYMNDVYICRKPS